MGSDGDERGLKNGKIEQIWKTSLACLCSFLTSMTGGIVLVWWEYLYHPQNRQLWMVPFGLILFSTPVIVGLSVFISDICNNSKDAQHASTQDQLVDSTDHSLVLHHSTKDDLRTNPIGPYGITLVWDWKPTTPSWNTINTCQFLRRSSKKIQKNTSYHRCQMLASTCGVVSGKRTEGIIRGKALFEKVYDVRESCPKVGFTFPGSLSPCFRLYMWGLRGDYLASSGRI
ncbi:putative ATP-synthase-associated protein [Dillenia turbinata]|uniref:ATP-synthase-associated protein n=1 Tax=Dillenia turbinata TaxID=194707 RepID=A0AAN8UQ87_9MAGN